MRRIQKILIGVFLAGVLLGGVGTGIAVVEYSSLNYGGRKVLGTENLVTETLDFNFKEDEKILVLSESFSGSYNSKRELVEDDAIPMGIVRYEVTYNDKMVKPYLHYQKYDIEETDDEAADGETADGEAADGEADPERVPEAGKLFLNVEYTGDDFEIFMENKDKILEDLKQGVLSSYDMARITEVKIRINPDMREYVVNEGKDYY